MYHVSDSIVRLIAVCFAQCKPCQTVLWNTLITLLWRNIDFFFHFLCYFKFSSYFKDDSVLQKLKLQSYKYERVLWNLLFKRIARTEISEAYNLSVQIIAYVNAYDQIGANVRQITIALSNTKNRVFFNIRLRLFFKVT